MPSNHEIDNEEREKELEARVLLSMLSINPDCFCLLKTFNSWREYHTSNRAHTNSLVDQRTQTPGMKRSKLCGRSVYMITSFETSYFC